MTNIVQTGDKVLRETAQEIALTEIKTPKIKNILNKMSAALSQRNDGVALAAPQIGVSLRIFIILKEYTKRKPAEEIQKTLEKKLAEKNKKSAERKKIETVVFINPKITKISKKKQMAREGCLSVDGIFGTTARAEKVTVGAHNEKGEKFTRGASGLLAQIIQHEMDHLNGVLFTDTATNLEKISAK